MRNPNESDRSLENNLVEDSFIQLVQTPPGRLQRIKEGIGQTVNCGLALSAIEAAKATRALSLAANRLIYENRIRAAAEKLEECELARDPQRLEYENKEPWYCWRFPDNVSPTGVTTPGDVKCGPNKDGSNGFNDCLLHYRQETDKATEEYRNAAKLIHETFRGIIQDIMKKNPQCFPNVTSAG